MKRQNKEQIILDVKEFLIANGWKEDNYGNLKIQRGGELYRMKFNSTSIRKESQVTHSDGSKVWIRLRTAYYKDIKIENGKIFGFKF